MKQGIRSILFICSFVFLLIYLINQKNLNYFLISAECLLLVNICYSFEKANRRIVFLFFNLMIQFFLLNMPLIDMLRGNAWWNIFGQDYRFAIMLVWISLFALFIGAYLGDILIVHYCNQLAAKVLPKNFIKNNYVKMCSKIVFLIAIFFAYVVGIEKLIFRSTNSYLDYYRLFHQNLPHLVYVVASTSEYALCVYLASLPKKKETYPILCLYVGASIPDLIVGQRNPIMLRAVFCVVYFFIRDFVLFKQKWISRFEKIGLFLGVPVALFVAGIVGNIRNAGTVQIKDAINILLDLFYYQGYTFGVIAKTPAVISDLHRNISFTFGGIIDYFIHGGLTRLFWGTTALPSGNNIIQATQSNSLAHQLSYALLGDEYLKGAGVGTSYMLELYLDFGIIGLFIFNLILGFLMIYGLKIMQYNILSYIIGLMCLLKLFLLPRAEATGFLTFLFVPYFWIIVIFIYAMALLFKRRYNGGLI